MRRALDEWLEHEDLGSGPAKGVFAVVGLDFLVHDPVSRRVTLEPPEIPRASWLVQPDRQAFVRMDLDDGFARFVLIGQPDVRAVTVYRGRRQPGRRRGSSSRARTRRT